MRNIYLDVSNVSRDDGGSSLASYAYISGVKAKDERLQQDFAYSRRAERIKATGNMLPENAPPEYEKAENWLNDIEKIEDRADARPAKKIVLAFPRKISPAKREEILRRWIEVNLTQQGYPATYAIHEDKAGNNPHAHIIVANRPLKDGKWLEVKSKTTYKLDKYGERVPVLEINEQTGKPIPVIDEQTGKQVRDKHDRPVYKQLCKTYKDGRSRKQWHRTTITDNPLDKKETLQAMRVTWAYSVNKHLDQADRVDWRTFEAQGLDIAPQIHEGYAARQIEARGGTSWKCEINRQIRDGNKQLLEAKARLATVQATKAASRARLDQLDQAEIDYYTVKPQPAPKPQTAQTGKAGGALGAVQGVASQTVGAVKGAVQEGVGAILGEADGRGIQGVMQDTAESMAKSLMQGDIKGAIMAPAKMPLGVLKSVESEDVKRDKMREQMEQAQAEQGLLLGGKSKSKSKGKDKGSKGKGQGEHTPLVRSRGGR